MAVKAGVEDHSPRALFPFEKPEEESLGREFLCSHPKQRQSLWCSLTLTEICVQREELGQIPNQPSLCQTAGGRGDGIQAPPVDPCSVIQTVGHVVAWIPKQP